MLGWIGPRGVAPKRMPKAEATTELAPEKASARNPPAVIRPSEGFRFWKERGLSLVKSRRSGGLGLENAKGRRAVFARRSFWFFRFSR